MADQDVMLKIVVTLKRNGSVSVKSFPHPEANESAASILEAGTLAEAQRMVLANRRIHKGAAVQDVA